MISWKNKTLMMQLIEFDTVTQKATVFEPDMEIEKENIFITDDALNIQRPLIIDNYYLIHFDNYGQGYLGQAIYTAKNKRPYDLETYAVEFDKIILADDSNFAVKFNELKTLLESLKTTFDSHTHTGVTTGGGVSGATATPLTIDTDSIKSTKIKIG